jgi:hypothetical protein
MPEPILRSLRFVYVRMGSFLYRPRVAALLRSFSRQKATIRNDLHFVLLVALFPLTFLVAQLIQCHT